VAKVRLPFDQEEESAGARPRYAEGDYLVKVKSAKPMRSKEKDTPGIEVVFRFVDGQYKNKEIHENLWITPKSMNRIRQMLEIWGMKVPKKAVNLELNNIKGKVLGITIEDDSYEDNRGKERVVSRVGYQFLTEDEVKNADVEEDEESEVDEFEDEDEEDEDEDIDLDEEDL
jgi:hypothetical protein